MVLGFLKRRVGKMVLARSTRNGLDLRTLKLLPDSVTMPLQRVGLDPMPKMTDVRASEPVKKLADLFGMGIWLVSGYDEARSVLAGGNAFSNDLTRIVSTNSSDAKDQIGGLGMTDPPGHTMLRKLLTPEFTRKRLARLEPRIEAIVNAKLDAMEAAGPDVDLVAEFAFPVPFEVICELLDLPIEDRAYFHSLGAARFDLSAGGTGIFDSAGESREFLIDAVAKQRANPGDGLSGGLLRDHGDELDDVVLGGLADGVFLGGYETSASMLALGSYLLAQHPAAMEMLRHDDATADRVVEELLRHLTVVQLAFVRFPREDMMIGTQQVKAGDVVGVSLLGANRDPALTPDADTFDPTREPTRHLAFGHGLHRCVGAELARMELRIALRALAHRFPDLTVTAPPEELSFRKLSAVYGVEALPVRLRDPHLAPA